MDVRGKVIDALRASLKVDYVRLEDDDGVSGYVVSPDFEGMSSVDRQEKIERAISQAPEPLSLEEQRRVLMVAGLTPAEYDEVGPRVRVHRLREGPDGTVEVLLHGALSDAEYVREAFGGVEGIETTEPENVEGALGVLVRFKAIGSPSGGPTRDRVVDVLKGDRSIILMPGA